MVPCFETMDFDRYWPFFDEITMLLPGTTFAPRVSASLGQYDT